MVREVRILLVGEPGVGKTSLILSLVSEEFPEDVPARAEEITIPADVTPEKVPTHIVDFSDREQDEHELTAEIMRSNVVCIVYSLDDDSTIERITSYWLPLLRRCVSEYNRRPVVLVGNKSDVIEVSKMQLTMPILDEYEEAETCIECSARTLQNISEVFYYAQKAVLHPTAPIFEQHENRLTARCREALVRIFQICDQDNDGLLNDREMSLFQRRCFNVPLQPQSLEDVKVIVRRHTSDGVLDDAVTLNGFLFLHLLFVERGRHETVWAVLRKFGYDEGLRLEYAPPHLNVPSACSTELSPIGVQFLDRLFDKYDVDRDNCLSQSELLTFFSTCPVMPWGPDVNNSVETNPFGFITRNGFFCQWAMTTLLDFHRSLLYLSYLGYTYEHETSLSAVQVTQDKRIDLQRRQTNRSVFQCHVIGPRGVGKTAFLQGFLGRNLSYVATLSRDHLSHFVANSVPVYGQEKYLVLHEIDIGLGLSDIMHTPEFKCDVVCLLYDVTNPRSFGVCARIYEQFLVGSTVPVLVVGCKAESPPVRQDHAMQPEQFCHKHRLAQPEMFKCVEHISSDVYEKLAYMAMYPHLRHFSQGSAALYASIGLGLAVMAGLGLCIYKYIRLKR